MFKSLKDKILDKAQDNFVYANHVSRLEQKEIERLFIRTFSSEDGQKALAYLQLVTFQRALAVTATNEQLRYMEGQRALISMILRFMDRGRTNPNSNPTQP